MSAPEARPRAALHDRPWRRRQVGAALLLAAGTTAATLGWIGVTLASYAWWGSPTSPLGALWWPGLAMFGVWALCRAWHARLLRQCRRRLEELHRD